MSLCVIFCRLEKTSHQVESQPVGDGREAFHWGDQLWWTRGALLQALGFLPAYGVVESCPLVESWNYLLYIIHSHGKSEMWEHLYSNGGKHVIRNIGNLYIYIFLSLKVIQYMMYYSQEYPLFWLFLHSTSMFKLSQHQGTRWKKWS